MDFETLVQGPVLLRRTLVTGTPASITLPVTRGFQALSLRILARNTGAGAVNLLMRFNGDTAANYDWQQLAGVDTGATAGAGAADTSLNIGGLPGTGAPVGAVSLTELTIPLPDGTTFEKTFVGTNYERRTDAVSGFRMRAIGGSWRPETALSSITLLLSSDTFADGSLVELRGES